MISKGHNQVGITVIWYEFVKQLLYFVKSAAALNEFLYLCLKSCFQCCMVRFYMTICNRTFSSSSLSVFICGLVALTSNCLRHRHFRFIIVSVHKINLLYKNGLYIHLFMDDLRFMEISAKEGRFLLFL